MQAASISFSDTIAATTTNWTKNLTLSQFTPALGTLTGVAFSYGGSVTSTFRIESTDTAPAVVAANLAATLDFGTPVSATLALSNSTTQAVTAFDGVVDFGGTSGFGPTSVTDTDVGVLSLVAPFATYVGGGTYNIAVAANGNSNATGTGNLATLISTNASAQIEVTYNYEPTVTTNVPEPGSLALVSLAMVDMGFAARRRKS